MATIPTTTTTPTTTPIPVQIGENCSNTNECVASDEHSECTNNTCTCKDMFFKYNETFCAEGKQYTFRKCQELGCGDLQNLTC